jgi:hypothetical protein
MAKALAVLSPVWVAPGVRRTSPGEIPASVVDVT